MLTIMVFGDNMNMPLQINTNTDIQIDNSDNAIILAKAICVACEVAAGNIVKPLQKPVNRPLTQEAVDTETYQGYFYSDN